MSFSTSMAIDTHIHLASEMLPNPLTDQFLNKYTAEKHPGRAVNVSREAGDLTEEKYA